MTQEKWIWAGVLTAALFVCSCAKPGVTPYPDTHIPPDQAYIPPGEPPPESLPQIGSLAPLDRHEPIRTRPAVVESLIQKAEKQLARKHPQAAFRILERALAVDGRDPFIWHLMAKSRLMEGRFYQARSLASKSNTLSGITPALRAKNIRIIARADAGLTSF